MAISPPSDILLDVARAANPAQVRDATARLARLAADPQATNEGFSKALAVAKSAGEVYPSPTSAKAAASTAMLSGAPTIRSAAHAAASPYRKFEAAMLQTFVESMLPKDDETFGDADSAGTYRSMLAQQLANQIADAGGIGIAKAVEKAHPPTGAASSHPAAAKTT